MAIITDKMAQSQGSEMGGQTDGAGIGRVESLLTPKLLRDRFLFGIPMYSVLPDPVTRKRAEYTDDMQKDCIERMANEIELHGGIDIQPVERIRRLPFDRQEYLNLGYFELPHRPILTIESLAVKTAQGQNLFDMPTQWIDPGGFARGRLNIIPLSPAYPGAGLLPTQAGGNPFLAILNSGGWVPYYFECRYITGFKEGRVPVVLNELIGIMAAVDILSVLGATNRIESYTVGQDGAQQTINTAGQNMYQTRITELKEKQKVALAKLKAKFGLKLFSGNV